MYKERMWLHKPYRLMEPEDRNESKGLHLPYSLMGSKEGGERIHGATHPPPSRE